MKQNKIDKYNEFYTDLFENWLDDILTDEEIINKEHEWLMKNGSEELFNYLIDKYNGSISEKKYKNYKKEFRKLTATDQVEKMFKRLNLKARYVDKSGCSSISSNFNKNKSN